MVGVQPMVPASAADLLGTPETRFPEVCGSRRPGAGYRAGGAEGGGGPVSALVGFSPTAVGSRRSATGPGTGCAGTPSGIGAGSRLRGSKGSDVLRECTGVVSGIMVVRDGRGCRADQQSYRADSASWRAVAEECFWQSQRVRLSLCGTDADGGPDTAVAETSCGGLPASRAGCSSVRPTRSGATDRHSELNGYQDGSAPHFESTSTTRPGVRGNHATKN